MELGWMQNIDFSKFKQCPCCSLWLSAREIIENPKIEINGMCFDEEDSDLNLFFFTHRVGNCNSTFTVPALDFALFITEDVPERFARGTEECGGHCTDRKDFRECAATCQFAPYRRFLRHLREIKKQERPAKLAV